jgi:hypothetical protein
MIAEQSGVTAAPERKWSTISAVVTRANGTVENRGIVSFSHRNPVINFFGAPLARLNGWFWERYYTRRFFK